LTPVISLQSVSSPPSFIALAIISAICFVLPLLE
jgi:hypothetical protein